MSAEELLHEAVPALPHPDSIWPEDRLKRALVEWRHTLQVRCPGCQGPALAGWLDGTPIAYACHRCGPAAQILPNDKVRQPNQ